MLAGEALPMNSLGTGKMQSGAVKFSSQASKH